MAAGIGGAHASGVRDRATIMTMLKPNADATPIVLASWFMATPNAFDGNDAAFIGNTALGSNSKGAFAPYWVKSAGKLIMEPLDNATDYDEPYFKAPYSSGKTALIEPYSYDIEGKPTLITTISHPVYSNGKLIGVAGIDLALGDISGMLGKMKPFGTGEVMLLSSDAKWVSHPDAKVRTKAYADAGGAEVKAAIADGKPIHIRGVKNAEGDEVDRLISPAPLDGLNSSWALVTDIPTKTINGPADRLAFALMIGGLVILALVLAALFAATNLVVRRPLSRLSAAVAAMGAGRYDEPIEGTDSADELGGIARALEGFRHDLAETGRLRTEQERSRAAGEEERRRNDEVRRVAEEQQRFVVTSVGEGLEKLSAGDLTYRLTAAFPEDYQKLRDDFNGAIGKLQDAMMVIVGNAAGIRSTTGEISDAANDLSRRTEQQAASLEETAAALDEITATVKQTAEGAERARGVVEEARKGAEKSGLVVGEAVEAMRAIETSSSQIAQITGVIDEIASSSSQVDQGVKLVAQTGAALKRVVEEVSEISSLVTGIAASAQEQASGLVQVNTAVNHMDQMTQQNAAMVEESTAASQALAQETAALSGLVGRFRIGETRVEETRRAAPAARPAAAVQRHAAPALKTVGGRGVSAAPRQQVAADDGWSEF